jgi:hypothetical protein
MDFIDNRYVCAHTRERERCDEDREREREKERKKKNGRDIYLNIHNT